MYSINVLIHDYINSKFQNHNANKALNKFLNNNLKYLTYAMTDYIIFKGLPKYPKDNAVGNYYFIKSFQTNFAISNKHQ